MLHHSSYRFLTVLLASLVWTACAPSTRDAAPEIKPEPEPLATPAPVADPVTASGTDETALGANPRAAILRAADLQIVDDAVRAAVTHRAPDLRLLAVRALGRIGDPATIGLVETALGDADGDVRAEAAFARALIGGPGAVDAIRPLTDDPAVRVRAYTAAALGLLADPTSEFELLRLLSDREPVVAATACSATARFASGDFSVDKLLSLASTNEPVVAAAANYALAELSANPGQLSFAETRKVRKLLIQLTRSLIPELRVVAARGLRVPSGEAEIESLAVLFEDPDPRVRAAAVTSVSFPGAPIDPFLSKTLDDPDDRVVLATVRGLGRLADETAFDLLVGVVLDDPRIWLKVEAIGALPRINRVRAAAVANGLSRDADAAIRAAAARLVVGRTDERSLEIAQRLMADADPEVRRAVLPAMAAAPAPLTETLGEVARRGDAAIRLVVIDTAGTRLTDATRDDADRRDVLALLDEVWRLAKKENQPRVMERILHVTRPVASDPRVSAMVREALTSDDVRLRKKATRFMISVYGVSRSTLDESAPVPSLERYAEILHWAGRPRASVITVERSGFAPARFTVSLDTITAPLTSWRFAQLAEAGFLDDAVFRQLVPDAWIRLEPAAGGPGDGLIWDANEPHPGAFATGTLASGASSSDGRWFVTLAPQPQLSGHFTAFGRVVQNFGGVVVLMLPGDRIVSVEIYQGTGAEPLQSSERQSPS